MKMEEFTKVIIIMIKSMALAHIFGQTAKRILEASSMANNMESLSSPIPKANLERASGKKEPVSVGSKTPPTTSALLSLSTRKSTV